MRTFVLVAVSALALLGVGCFTGTPDPKPDETLPQNENGNLTLYVSNQSLALTPVDITIHIDGRKAIAGDFDVTGERFPQHNWIKHVFALSPGKHTLTVVSEKGEAALERGFEIEDKHWAVVDYWYYPESHHNPTPKHFTFTIQDSPIGFQ
jgi:hypothetical protein